MLIDRKDAMIIKTFRDHSSEKSISPYFIAKKIFGLTNSRENLHERRAKGKFVEERLKRMVRLGLINTWKEQKGKRQFNCYQVIDEKCVFGTNHIEWTIDGEKVSVNMPGDFLLLIPNSKEWHCISL